MDSSPVSSILLFLVFIIINVIMYGFASAVCAISESEVQKKAEEGNLKAKKLYKIIDNPSRFIGTIQLSATSMSVIIGYFQATYFSALLSSKLEKILSCKIDAWGCYVISVVIVILALLVIYLSFGVMIPKKIGARQADMFAYGCVNIVYAIIIVLYPVTLIIEGVSFLILHVFGISANDNEDNVTEDEIISMVHEGHEQGILEQKEAEMISNIMELDEKNAGDIMTHRKNIVAVDGELILEDAVAYMLEESNSRFPVYIDDIDNIIGILHLRDAVACLNKEHKGSWKIKDLTEIIREAKFIPETRNIDTLFRQMQSEKNHMVIVIDEYGQTAGIVAMEDILEEIVGNIFDEYDEEEHNIVKQSDNVYIIKGMTPLSDLEDEISIEYEKEDYDTLNGYLIEKLGRIPSDGEKPVIEDGRCRYDVISIEHKMISLVKLTIKDIITPNLDLEQNID